MIWKLGLTSGVVTCAVIAWVVGFWGWVAAIFILSILFGLVSLGGLDAEPDRSGLQKWGDGSGGGSGE